MIIDTWAVVLATFLGPIFAVMITRYMDDRRAEKERRLNIFRSLMKDRAFGLSDDFVAAINLIEVEFNKETQVMNAWKEVRDAHNKKPHDADNLKRKTDAMLQEIGKTLGHEVRVDFIDGYAPRLWVDNFDRITNRDNLIIELLENKRSLNLNIADNIQKTNQQNS